MEMIIIIALLASNVWLIRKVLAKPDAPQAEKDEPPKVTEQPLIEDDLSDVVGKSSFDVQQFMDSFREVAKETAKEAATEVAKEIIPLIVKEPGTPEDAGLPEPPVETPDARVPDEKLDEVFSSLSASELTGEPPVPAEPNAEGVDFEEMRRTIDVLKGNSDKPEDEKTARKVLSQLEGTEIIEYVKLDPVVRKRILMIECQMPDIPEQEPEAKAEDTETKAKKIVFHADIDTSDIDAIDFNILH